MMAKEVINGLCARVELPDIPPSWKQRKKICLKALLKRQISLRDESIASAKIVYVLFVFLSLMGDSGLFW